MFSILLYAIAGLFFTVSLSCVVMVWALVGDDRRKHFVYLIFFCWIVIPLFLIAARLHA